MRSIALAVALVLLLPGAACADGLVVTQDTPGQMNFRYDQNNPSHLQVTNLFPKGANTYSEFRVMTAAGAGDFGLTGPGFNDGSDLLAGEVFVVSESTAAGLHLKSNGDNYIRGSIGLRPQEVFRFTQGGLAVTGYQPNATLTLTNQSSGVNVGFLADDGNGYVGTKSAHPLQLMVGYNAKVTVWPAGQVELWRVAAEPTSNPTNGGFLYVAPDGSLKYRGPHGTVTTLAQP